MFHDTGDLQLVIRSNDLSMNHCNKVNLKHLGNNQFPNIKMKQVLNWSLVSQFTAPCNYSGFFFFLRATCDVIHDTEDVHH
jgi:hypothetical protein